MYTLLIIAPVEGSDSANTHKPLLNITLPKISMETHIEIQ